LKINNTSQSKDMGHRRSRHQKEENCIIKRILTMMIRFLLVSVTIGATAGFSPGTLRSETSLTSKTSLEGLSRRDLFDASAVSLAGLVLGQVSPVFAADEAPKTILMTGSNSGIGFEAAKKLALAGHKLILPSRTLDKAVATVAALGGGPNIIPAECDLADLSSIEKFGRELPSLMGSGVSLDIACLNAGLARNTGATDVARTKDGFELTVGTNHFGHFYLNSLLVPKLQPRGRIVVTASSVHDPDSPGGAQGKTATLGDLTGLTREGNNFEMVDGNPFNADKAYKDSKVCQHEHYLEHLLATTLFFDP
jgi:protochlorophyllide reductase